jgi:hypothetical protein
MSFGQLLAHYLREMQKETIIERPSPLAAPTTSTRPGLRLPDEPFNLPAPPDKLIDTERDYLASCQKLEQLIERKQRAVEETVDVAALHQELCLIGSRIQREPNDPSHEDDYAAVLRRVKESLWRKIEAEDLKGEFQKLHFELLGLGHRLGFDASPDVPDSPSFRPPAARSVMTEAHRVPFNADSADEINLGDVERQIADLQAQIRGLHDHR